MELPRTRIPLACGALAGPIFLAVALITGALRADYDPLRHPISGLALGEHGWTQTVNFLLAGTLYVAFAIGLRTALKPGPGRLWTPILVAAWGIGMIGSGLFVTDPVGGYPPGTPDLPTEPTTVGALHDLFALPVFLGFPVLCLVATRRFITERRVDWTVYTLLSAVAFTTAFLLSGAGFDREPGLADIAGLLQRTTVAIGLAWLTLLAANLLRTRSSRLST